MKFIHQSVTAPQIILAGRLQLQYRQCFRSFLTGPFRWLSQSRSALPLEKTSCRRFAIPP
jgi:hypothetical protein